MKTVFSSLFFIFILFANTSASAQGSFSISGTVFDENKAVVKGATVFISGSQKITSTNDNGNFKFDGLNAGSYQLVVKLIGDFPFFQNIRLSQKAVELSIYLKTNPYTLNEVVIGADKDRPGKYAVFKENFLGTSPNANECKILNPEILKLKYNKKNNTLEATTNDFLIIENRRLGYKIKYLLKAFEYHYQTRITNYDGETSFEDMDGPAQLKKKWVKNRLKTYKGSLMHFLRAVYKSKDAPLKEGFLIRPIYGQIGEGDQGRMTQFLVDTRPVKFDSLVSVIDTSFISLRFKSKLYVVYDPNIAFKVKITGNYNADEKKWIQFSYDASVLHLTLKEAIIDSKGGYTDYHDFLITGTWGEMRVGDQLPFEYQPPK